MPGRADWGLFLHQIASLAAWFRAAPMLALAAALLTVSGCASVSLDSAAMPRSEQSALHNAAAELRRVFAAEGWGVAEDEPGAAQRLTSMLLRGRAEAPEQTPLERYLARLPAGEGAGAQLGADLERAAHLVDAANLAANAARGGAFDARGAELDLAETESAAQTALRGARFFDEAVTAMASRLRSSEHTALRARQEQLRAGAETLTGHADAFAERRRAALAASS